MCESKKLWTLAACLILSACQRGTETYAAGCSIPLAGWGREADGLYELRPTMPIYLTSDGSLLWNRKAISNPELGRRLNEAASFTVAPQVVLEVAPSAECTRVGAVRDVMNDTQLCRDGGCSEGWNHNQWPLPSN